VLGLLVIGFFAGLIAGVSPCILPILPVVLVGWSTPVEGVTNEKSAKRRRALAVVSGLVVSFSIITALGSVILSSLGLPQDLLRNVGIALLIIFGVGLIWPQLGHLIERPFARLAGRAPTGTRSGFVLGLGLGLVFVPCAGPVLAAISVLGARHHASFFSLLLSFCFGIGAATPLFAVALAGDRLIERNRRLSTKSRKLRPVAGVLLIAMALAITFNAANVLQRDLPGYTQSLQHWVEGNHYTVKELRQLQHQSTTGSLAACEGVAANGEMNGLSECGVAPDFQGITAWLNTPKDRPLSLSQLKGKVVLVDFWTYSCINCQRTLPHVEAWYQRYHSYGLDIVGVEAPEFAFEHVVSNVAAADKTLGVKYPVAIDDNLDTWSAYANEYWPAEYLIGGNGVIRHVSYGEGNYANDEQFIRTLLRQANLSVVLPPATNVADLTPTEATNPETYLGTERSSYLQAETMTDGVTQTFSPPSALSTDMYDLAGSWTPSSQDIIAGKNASLNLQFSGDHDIYLVLGGKGSVNVAVNGVVTKTVPVTGFPTLYTLLSSPSAQSGVMTLSFTPGVQAYDFTFG